MSAKQQLSPAFRALAILVSIACALLFTAGLASDASAAKKKVRSKITAPRDNAVVARTFTVRLRVHAPRGRYKVRYYLNGRLLATKRGARTERTLRKLRVTAGSVGAQRLRTVVTSRGQRSTKVVNLSTLNTLASLPAATENFVFRFFEDFTRPAAPGSMGSYSDPTKVVYTGDSGSKWVTYPRTYVDTYDKRPYRADRVLSVHDGVLDYHLQPVDGQPAGANLSPLVQGGSQYQTYGRYSARIKVDNTDLSEYYIAWLLWPQDESAWASAESDFPEGPLVPGRSGVHAYSHYAPGGTEGFFDPDFDMHEWHVYTQDWLPGLRRYYVDGKLIGSTTTPIYSGPQRWQLQIETKDNGAHNGHVLVDWVAVYGL